MAQVLSDLNPTFVLAVLLPLGVLITGRALQVACRVCSVEPPDFWHSVLAVVMICVSNIVLQFWLRVTEAPADFSTQILAPAVTTAIVIAMSIRTGPLAALKVTFVHGVLCGLIYCVANVMGKVLIAGVL
ncbi:MAG: hypothetical protein IH831_06430 [Planctomycetes bacterium]|nr:hypothetical protein [Planctomycetota bacterium]